ncbi:primosomal protein N' [Ruicaihuangia caeni]|uniref:primosomal protein N' family DNA-binding protein n=1 Tax=Ruicaihuangia caeni TaxID=3042517 RepID=UPI00338E88FA
MTTVEGGRTIARVVLDSPLPQLDRLFDYEVPETLVGQARPGVRVRVPLRSAGRIADGYLVELTDAVDYDGVLSELDDVVSPVPALAPEIWELARRVADRAAGTASDVLRLAVPRRYVRAERTWLERRGGERAPSVSGAPEPASDRNTDAEASSGALDAGLAAVVEERSRVAIAAPAGVQQTGDGTWVPRWAAMLADAATATIAAGRTAIIAVPDYRDQAALETALLDRLPADRVVRADARQTGTERYRAHLRCLETASPNDEALVIVGTRVALYAPAANLGLIAMWNDGDPLFAEPHTPAVHARDVALIRQQLQDCALIFAGHTRTTDVQRLVEIGWVQPKTAAPQHAPRIVLTALQRSGDRIADTARIPSTAWQAAAAAVKEGPVLVQVAQPGFAPRLVCADCARTAHCQRCDGPFVQRSASSPPVCRWCGALAAAWRCPHCDGARMRRAGSGSVSTADDLGRAFPGALVRVADGERPLQRVDGKPALVVATRGAEPIADGGYRAVLLLDGASMLARESLRVAEDCLRWWSHAASLAADGAPVMLVGVDGDIATDFALWRFDRHAERELGDRRRLRFPPAVRVATLTGRSDVVERAITELERDVAGSDQHGDGARHEPHSDVLGPVVTEPGVARAIVRFDYGAGVRVAQSLKASVIRAATAKRKPVPGQPRNRSQTPLLRVRFDDPDPFTE